MREIFEQLEILRIEDKEVFLTEIELLNPPPTPEQLFEFENEFPEVVEAIIEIRRIIKISES